MIFKTFARRLVAVVVLVVPLAMAGVSAHAKACSEAEAARNKATVLAFSADESSGPRDLQQRAEKYMTSRYIQHHPGVASGRQAFIDYHIQWYKDNPQTSRVPHAVVAIVAECDMVMTMTMSKKPHADPDHPGKTYDVFHFNLFRMKDGKVDEHWDSDTER